MRPLVNNLPIVSKIENDCKIQNVYNNLFVVYERETVPE